ncbi:carbonic anhydrase [Oerskovia gallyi]|uniref:carbonic anhydrase n=1 Tax=Oerskovia gallyi TaxID=2762226 RepID=A0ABR8UY43_9CELL|nr:carbonic anhydrase family protein [Oerskovia gallyi]MBD7997307.1 carbonic anhydrase family protein [Oerskovia gallyi]
MTKYAAFYVPLTAAALALTGGVSAWAAPASAPTSTAALAPASIPAGALELAPPGGGWSYEGGAGPEHWGEIASTCASTPTSRQSPVDIPLRSLTESRKVKAPVLDYERAAFTVRDTGETIQGDLTTVGSNAITLDGTRFELRQFHLHTPSEHMIDGEPAAMELHLVHQSAEGRLAVLGVLLELGRENAALAGFFDAIPSAATATSSVAPRPVEINPAHLVPGWSDLIRYDGSLTTPPCSEGVLWNVYERPRTISKSQLAAFTAVHPENSRPVQPLNGRSLFEVDAD